MQHGGWAGKFVRMYPVVPQIQMVLFVSNFRRYTQQVLHASTRSTGGGRKYPLFSGEIANLKKKTIQVCYILKLKCSNRNKVNDIIKQYLNGTASTHLWNKIQTRPVRDRKNSAFVQYLLTPILSCR